METKKFTKAQKRMLTDKVRQSNMAQGALNEFVGYLREEHGVDESWQILQNLTGFEKPEKPKKPETPKKE